MLIAEQMLREDGCGTPAEYREDCQTLHHYALVKAQYAAAELRKAAECAGLPEMQAALACAARAVDALAELRPRLVA